MLKLVFAGTPDVAVPSLKAFAADPRFDVVGVITRPDAPTGRGRKLTPSPVKATALELGLPVIDLKPRSPEFMEALNNLHADIAAVIAYGNILPKNVLDAVPMGWYNLHFSNLPKWRGAAPAQRAIWAGDPTTGADVFKVGEGLDDGPIVASLTIELTGRETSGELLDRLAEEGAPMYVDALAAVGEGTATFTAQPAEGLEYAHKITVEDARISWTDEAEAIDRQVRACTPHPGAWTELFAEGPIADNDEPAAKPLTLHILAAQPADQSNPNTPAELQPGELKVGKKNVWVGTGSTPLELTQVKAQGKKVVVAAADTFRAAAIEQLTEWSNRAGVDIIAQQEGSDPAAVIYDACQAAKSRHADILLCDTAGRLHNKKNLMEELRKIYRILEKEYPEAYLETLVVLDGTTGQNALVQARQFAEVANVTGIILTKLDGTAKGGIAVAIQSELDIPVKYIGVGESIDDLQKFDANSFVDALFDIHPDEN